MKKFLAALSIAIMFLTVPALAQEEPTLNGLAQRMAGVESDVGTLQSQVSDLQADVTVLQSDLATLTATVVANSNEITSMLSDISVAVTSLVTMDGRVFILESAEGFKVVPSLTETTSAAAHGLMTNDFVYSPNCTFSGVTRNFCIGRMQSSTMIAIILSQTIGSTTVTASFLATIQP